MKPLKFDNEVKKEDGDKSADGNKLYHDKNTDETFQHAPAKNQGELKEETKIRDKLSEQKEKRKLHDKFL